MLKVYKLRRKQNTFEITLSYKGVGVRVSFTDGNTYNGTPARCYTSDLFRQKAIEASQLYKDHEIVLERTVEEAGDKKPHTVVGAVKKVSRSAVSKPAQKPAPKPAPKPNPAPTPTVEDPDPTPDEGQGEGGSDSGMVEKSFENLGEAILYIAQNFKQQVQTEKEARDILKANGIKPKIKKG